MAKQKRTKVRTTAVKGPNGTSTPSADNNVLANPRAAKAKAAKAQPKSRRVFPVGQCHHRDSKGQPDCKKQIVAKRANLCPEHESIWQKAARQRYAANRAARQAAPEETTTDADAAVATEGADDLEAQLEASVAAFATPELAAQAKAKRAAQKSSKK